MNEYLLIVYTESSDEIHFIIIDYIHHDKILDLLNTDFNKMIEYIYNNKEYSDYIQSYCYNDYIYKKWNIVKYIHLPELGC